MIKTLAIITTLAIHSFSYANELCDALRSNFKIQISTQDKHVYEAGENLPMHVQVDVLDPNLLASKKSLWISFILSSNLPGSSVIQEALDVKETIDGEVVFKNHFDLSPIIPKNYIGRYTSDLSALLFINNQYCRIQFKEEGEPFFIDVVNSSGLADITPPTIVNVDLSEAPVALGSKTRIYVDVLDQSEICTEEQKNQGLCPGIWHIQFLELSSNRKVDLFPPLFKEKDGRYYTEFQVAGLEPNNMFDEGQFQLIVFDVGDIWNNLYVTLPPSLRKILTVSASSSLL